MDGEKAAKAGGIVPLPKVIRKLGFTFTQIWRRDDVAIFEQSKPGWSKPAYEVILIRIVKGHPKGKNADRLVERYPSNNDWGTWGWTHNEFLDAERAALHAWKDQRAKREADLSKCA